MVIERQPSCDDVNESGLLPVAIARARLMERISALPQQQMVPVREALERVAFTDIKSPIDVPGYTNSAMDGYACNSADFPAIGERTLELLGTVWAGKPLNNKVKSGQAARIMTGGMMPEGTDTVIIQEHAQATEFCVTIENSTPPGRNVRHAGEDIGSGDTVIEKGTRLMPAHIGMMASLGIDRVAVHVRPKVAFFSTGDELCALEQFAGQTLGPGQLFDSNRHTLFALLTRLGVELVDLGIVADTQEATRAALQRAGEVADLTISSGGVSAGAADFVSETLAELGEVAFWKLAMRPGRPLAFGQVGGSHFFGLPGNPVAVMVTFYEFVQPAILKLAGCQQTEPFSVSVPCDSRLRKSAGRIEYQRGLLQHDANGVLRVAITGKQGAGRLSSMCVANCLIVLEEAREGVEPGEFVSVQPFYGLV